MLSICETGTIFIDPIQLIGSVSNAVSVLLLALGVILGIAGTAVHFIRKSGHGTEQAALKARELEALQEQLTITNEELQTSKEEMEIGIEELNLVNEELRSRNEDLNQLNSELLRLRQLHDQIIQVVPAAILTMDEKLRIVSMNDSCRRLSIWRDGDAGEGFQLMEVLHPRFANESGFAGIAAAAFDTEDTSKEIEISFLDETGRNHFYEITVCRVAQRSPAAGDEHEPSPCSGGHVFFIIREVSALRELSSEIEIRDKLMEEMKVSLREEAAAERKKVRKEKWDALKRVGSAIAADMKHILNGIDEKVKAMRGSKIESSLAGSLDGIREIAERGMQVVSRIEKEINRAVVSPDGYSLDDAVGEALAGTMVSKSRRTEIDLQLDLSCGCVVRAGRENIIECLHNVVENAIEAMPSGGILQVSTQTREGFGVATVCDHGIGMSQLEVREAFEPYFSTRDEEGAGLGLSVVKSIIQRVGGKVSIKSEKGKGTTVELWFPVSDD